MFDMNFNSSFMRDPRARFYRPVRRIVFSDQADRVEKLVDSMTVSGDQITFVIPEDVEGSEGLTIRVFGRAVYSDGFSQSLHLLEGSSWQAGELYTIPLDSSYTELTMYIGWQEGTPLPPADLAVISPGIRPDSPMAQAARNE